VQFVFFVFLLFYDLLITFLEIKKLRSMYLCYASLPFW